MADDKSLTTTGIAGMFTRQMVERDVDLFRASGCYGPYVLIKHPCSYLPDVSDLCKVVYSELMSPHEYLLMAE